MTTDELKKLQNALRRKLQNILKKETGTYGYVKNPRGSVWERRVNGLTLLMGFQVVRFSDSLQIQFRYGYSFVYEISRLSVSLADENDRKFWNDFCRDIEGLGRNSYGVSASKEWRIGGDELTTPQDVEPLVESFKEFLLETSLPFLNKYSSWQDVSYDYEEASQYYIQSKGRGPFFISLSWIPFDMGMLRLRQDRPQEALEYLQEFFDEKANEARGYKDCPQEYELLKKFFENKKAEIPCSFIFREGTRILSDTIAKGISVNQIP